MLLKRAVLDCVRAGSVDRAYRRWKRPAVKEGTRLRTAVGLVEVTAVRRIEARDLGNALYEIGLRWAGEDPRIALRDETDLTGLQAAIDRIDRRRGDRPPCRAVLELISARPATRAADLAADAGMEKAPFKRLVRRLKELGLTESLSPGYRLSPRGEAYLAAAGGGGRIGSGP